MNHCLGEIKAGFYTPGRYGFSVDPGWQGRGFATEALRKVLEYLTENEVISCVTAWCAAENIGSQKVLEKVGMKQIREEKTKDHLLHNAISQND